MVLAAGDPEDLACFLDVDPGGLRVVVEIEDQPTGRSARLRQDGYGAPVGAFDEPAHHAQIAHARHAGAAIGAGVVLPVVVQGKRLSPITRLEDDAVQVDPAMVLATGDPDHLAARQHIDSCRVGVVVEVEDKPPGWVAILWQHRQGAPGAALDQAAHNAQAAHSSHPGLPIATTVVDPAILERQVFTPFAGFQHDPVKADPAVALAAGDPKHLAAGFHIHARGLLMVVEIEDHPSRRTAVQGQVGQQGPAALLDEPTCHTQSLPGSLHRRGHGQCNLRPLLDLVAGLR